MRPRGMPSRWVKLRPWFYTKRTQPSRQREIHVALKAELAEPEIARCIVDALERHVAAGGRLNLR